MQHSNKLTVFYIALLTALFMACNDDRVITTGSTSETLSGTTGEPTGTTDSDTAPSTEGDTDSEGVDICQGEPHTEYQEALCPDTYCIYAPPGTRPTGFEDCAAAGFGPVGSGECACVPDVYNCLSTDSGPDQFYCCCPRPEWSL